VEDENRVGIGTLYPTQSLDTTGSIAVGNSQQVQFRGSGGAISSIRTVGTGDLTFRTDSIDAMIVDNGKVGISTTTPNSLLSIATSTNWTMAGMNAALMEIYQTSEVGKSPSIPNILINASTTQPVIKVIQPSTSSNAGPNLVLMSGTGGAIGINNVTPAGALDIYGNSAAQSSLYFSRFVNSALPPTILLQKSRNDTLGSHTVVQNADQVGSIIFSGSDGTNFEQAGYIAGEVDGTPGNDDMPGRLVFYTTPNDTKTPALRMMIRQNGYIGVNQTNPTGSLFSIATSTNWLMGGSSVVASSFYITQTSEVGAVATKVPTAFISASSTYPALRVMQPDTSSNAGTALHVSAVNATTTLYVVGNSRFEGNMLATGNATTTLNHAVNGNMSVGTVQPTSLRGINVNSFSSSAATTNYGVYASTTVTGAGGVPYGIYGLSKNTLSVLGNAYGVYGNAISEVPSGNTAYGVYGTASGGSSNYGVYGTVAAGATNYAGYFLGNLYTSGSSTTTDNFTHIGRTAVFASSTAATTTAGVFVFGKTGTATTTLGVGSVTQKGCIELSDSSGAIYRIIVDAGVLNVKLGRCN
ncbi:MAG: hypothetical protein M1308_15655, partial [Actinobacteria bacterium]|nr:hypothetical protein [Actinomycetota bacterium]